MKKQSAVENSQVNDSGGGGMIKISTTARIMYRKLNPSWQKSKNADLNKVIAQQFSSLPTKSFFRPKKKMPEEVRGEIREGGGVKFIALSFPDEIWVIAAKGAPKISAPAPVELPEQSARDTWLKSHRGFLENHFYDLFDGMYNLDGGYESIVQSINGHDPIKYLKDLHISGKDAVIGAAAAALGNLSVRQLNTEPTDYDIHRIFSVPMGRKL